MLPGKNLLLLLGYFCLLVTAIDRFHQGQGNGRVNFIPSIPGTSCPTLAPKTAAPIICSNTSNFEGEASVATSGAALLSDNNVSIGFSFYYNNSDCSVVNPQNFTVYNIVVYLPLICSSSGEIIVPIVLANQTVNNVPTDTVVTIAPIVAALNSTALCPGGILSLAPMSEVLFTGYIASSAANTFVQGSFALNVSTGGAVVLSVNDAIGATATYDLACIAINIICPNVTNGDFDFQFCSDNSQLSYNDTIQFGQQFTSNVNNSMITFYNRKLFIELACNGQIILAEFGLPNQVYNNVIAGVATPGTIVYQTLNFSSIAALCSNGLLSFISPAEVIVTQSIAAGDNATIVTGSYSLIITASNNAVITTVNGIIGPKMVYPLTCVVAATPVPTPTPEPGNCFGPNSGFFNIPLVVPIGSFNTSAILYGGLFSFINAGTQAQGFVIQNGLFHLNYICSSQPNVTRSTTLTLADRFFDIIPVGAIATVYQSNRQPGSNPIGIITNCINSSDLITFISGNFSGLFLGRFFFSPVFLNNNITIVTNMGNVTGSTPFYPVNAVTSITLNQHNNYGITPVLANNVVSVNQVFCLNNIAITNNGPAQSFFVSNINYVYFDICNANTVEGFGGFTTFNLLTDIIATDQTTIVNVQMCATGSCSNSFLTVVENILLFSQITATSFSTSIDISYNITVNNVSGASYVTASPALDFSIGTCTSPPMTPAPVTTIPPMTPVCPTMVLVNQIANDLTFVGSMSTDGIVGTPEFEFTNFSPVTQNFVFYNINASFTGYCDTNASNVITFISTPGNFNFQNVAAGQTVSIFDSVGGGNIGFTYLKTNFNAICPGSNFTITGTALFTFQVASTVPSTISVTNIIVFSFPGNVSFNSTSLPLTVLTIDANCISCPNVPNLNIEYNLAPRAYFDGDNFCPITAIFYQFNGSNPTVSFTNVAISFFSYCSSDLTTLIGQTMPVGDFSFMFDQGQIVIYGLRCPSSISVSTFCPASSNYLIILGTIKVGFRITASNPIDPLLVNIVSQGGVFTNGLVSNGTGFFPTTVGPLGSCDLAPYGNNPNPIIGDNRNDANSMSLPILKSHSIKQVNGAMKTLLPIAFVAGLTIFTILVVIVIRRRKTPLSESEQSLL